MNNPTIIFCFKCHDDTEHKIVNHNGTKLYTCDCGRTVDHHYDELNSDDKLEEVGFTNGHFASYCTN